MYISGCFNGITQKTCNLLRCNMRLDGGSDWSSVYSGRDKRSVVS